MTHLDPARVLRIVGVLADMVEQCTTERDALDGELSMTKEHFSNYVADALVREQELAERSKRGRDLLDAIADLCNQELEGAADMPAGRARHDMARHILQLFQDHGWPSAPGWPVPTDGEETPRG